MSNMYLMSAYALTERKRAPITEIMKHWPNSTVYVLRSATGKLMFASSAGDLGYKVGEHHTMIKDTGRGYTWLSLVDRDMIVENIVTMGKDVATGEQTIVKKENNVGLDEKRAIYVFK